MTPPLRLKDAITSRLKIMAKLDIAEKRLPQDGRIMIKYKAEGKKRNSTSAFRPSRPCMAKKSSCGCWTRKTSGWT